MQTRNSIRGFVRPSVGPSVCRPDRNTRVETWKPSVLEAFFVFVLVVGAWGVAGGWIPLPTRPQRYCDPASLVRFVHQFCASVLFISFVHQFCSSVLFISCSTVVHFDFRHVRVGVGFTTYQAILNAKSEDAIQQKIDATINKHRQ